MPHDLVGSNTNMTCASPWYFWGKPRLLLLATTFPTNFPPVFSSLSSQLLCFFLLLSGLVLNLGSPSQYDVGKYQCYPKLSYS